MNANLTGKFLVASVMMRDPVFRHKIVLITNHVNGMISGVIINQYSNITHAQAWTELKGEETYMPISENLVRIGGPVYAPVVMLHTHPEMGEEVMPGLYKTYDKDLMEVAINFEAKHNIYIGFTSWFEGQLAAEIDAGYWVAIEHTDLDQIFNYYDPEDVWAEHLRKITEKIIGDHGGFEELN